MLSSVKMVEQDTYNRMRISSLSRKYRAKLQSKGLRSDGSSRGRRANLLTANSSKNMQTESWRYRSLPPSKSTGLDLGGGRQLTSAWKRIHAVMSQKRLVDVLAGWQAQWSRKQKVDDSKGRKKMKQGLEGRRSVSEGGPVRSIRSAPLPSHRACLPGQLHS
jgi:hypothetical protein